MGNGYHLERWDQTAHSYWTKSTLERSALDAGLDATKHQGYWILQAPEILDAIGTRDIGWRGK
jgi:hypothetical protein